MAKLKETEHFKIVTIRGATFEEAMKDYGRRKAYDSIEKIRRKNKVFLSTKEILKIRDRGRK